MKHFWSGILCALSLLWLTAVAAADAPAVTPDESLSAGNTIKAGLLTELTEDEEGFEPVPAPPPDITPDLFRTVCDADIPLLTQLLDNGANPNATLPVPAPMDVAIRMRKAKLEYFLGAEKGFTPLMLAASLGYPEAVKLLLDRGAKRHAYTKRHRTSALWLAGYFGHAEIIQILLGIEAGSEAARTLIRISIAEQTAWLSRDGSISRTMPVSTGRKQFPTPKGQFVVTDKYKDWKSTIYPAKMPYFLRLSCKDFGMHAGALPGYPASHGCIRRQAADAKAPFAEVPGGTLGEIE